MADGSLRRSRPSLGRPGAAPDARGCRFRTKRSRRSSNRHVRRRVREDVYPNFLGNQKVKRRTRVIGIFSMPDSLTRLVGTRIAQQDVAWQVAYRHSRSGGSKSKVDELEGGEDPNSYSLRSPRKRDGGDESLTT